MTEAVFETKLSTEEQTLQALAVLSYTGTRLARDEKRNAMSVNADSVTSGTMPEKTRVRIRRAIRRGMLARHIVIAAMIALVLLAAAYASVLAYTAPYDISLVHGSYPAEPVGIERPLDKAVVVGAVRWLERNMPTDPIPEAEAPLHILMGGSGYAVTDISSGELLYSVIPHGRSSVQVWQNGQLTEYEDVPLRIMRAFDRMRRRIDPVYAEEVPEDYYIEPVYKHDSVKENDIYPRSPYSVFRP